MIFCILFIIFHQIFLTELNEGDIGFIIECHVYRNLSGSGCDTPGNFHGWYFFTTYGNAMRDLSSNSTEHIPSANYELTWKNAEENLEHYYSCKAIGLHGTCQAGSDDYAFCTQSYSGEIGGCWNENQVRCRRLGFRFCPPGHYFKGLITKICARCPDHYFSPALNTDLNCTYCPFPTEGISCNCPPGTYVTPQGCEKCPPGEYQNLPGQTSCKNCSEVSPYAYSDEAGSTECKTCKHKVSGGGSDCMQCEPGYQWESGDQCEECAIGKYQPTESDGPCLKCSDLGDKYYQDQKGQSKCKECAHVAESEGTECMECGPGKEWETGDTCSPCDIGDYNPDTTDTPCKHCSDAGPYFYTNTTGQSECLTCPYKVWQGTVCAPACPHQAIPFRGSTNPHECICGVNTPQTLTVTSAYSDEDDICSIAVYEKIIDQNKGGPVTFYNGKISYQFGTEQEVSVDSVELSGEGPHTHPISSSASLKKNQKNMEEYIIQQEHKIISLKDENEELRTTLKKKEDYYYELESILEKISSYGEDYDWNGKLTKEKFDSIMENDNLMTKILDSKKIRKDEPERFVADSEFVRDAGNFDPRPLYPNCQWKVLPQLAQGVCGSCFCYSVVGSISYRRCILSNQSFTGILGMQDVLSCGSFSCSGGYATDVFSHLETTGTTLETCENYTSGRRGEIKACPKTCDDGSAKKYYYVEKGSLISDLSTSAAMANMQSQGPIVVKLPVYEDMLIYNDGVYTHKSGSYLFDHEILCLGFGTDSESGLDYWLCENSWGPNFGQDGYWKIERGKYFSAMMQAMPDFTR